MNKTLTFAFLGIALLVIIILVSVIFGRKPQDPTPASLTVWGIQDDESVWNGLIKAFQERAPHITLTYEQFPESTFEDTLINRLAEGTGPDIFMLKNAWIMKHRDKTFPLPQQFLGFTPRDFGKTFVDGMAQELIQEDGNITGLPLFVDTLALFYNKNVLNTAGVAAPPKTWEELAELSTELAQKSGPNTITRSGLALGEYDSIEHAFEIISALILQEGDTLVAGNRTDIDEGTLRALLRYTAFADATNEHFSWTAQLGNSLEAFAEERAVFYIGMSGDIARIQARNPHLNFAVAPLPQPERNETVITYGSYFFPAVSKQSPSIGQAWQFISFLTSTEGARLYLGATARPPARRDLVSAAPTTNLETFYRQSLTTRGWSIPDERPARAFLKDIIDSLNARTVSPERIIEYMRQRLTLLLP